MKNETIKSLSCPICGIIFEMLSRKEERECVIYGLLFCPQCFASVPVFSGFPVFSEMSPLTGEPSLQDLMDWETRLFGQSREYSLFLNQKRNRRSFDTFALFHPFNPICRTWFSLFEVLRKTIRPGQLILDTWCRTGWSGEALAYLFPENHIISIWESNHSILGFRGFRHWLPEHERAPNWDLIFFSPKQRLPFRTNAFGALHALDSVHLYPFFPFLPECFRVTDPDGLLIFPHVHLTDGNPDAFIAEERGGHMHPAKEYEDYFSRILQDDDRRIFIMSEIDLFNARDEFQIYNDPHLSHYNGLFLVTDKRWLGQVAEIPDFKDEWDETWRVLKNPLVDIDLHTGAIPFSYDAVEGLCDTLLRLHPIYAERIQGIENVILSTRQCQIIYWAQRLLTLGEISERTGFSMETIKEELAFLRDNELVQVHKTTAAMTRLQNYYGTLEFGPAHAENTFCELWKSVALRYGSRPLLTCEDGSAFDFEDADTLVQALTRLFHQHGLEQGDRLLIQAHPHPEYCFSIWAALLQGLTVVPIDPDWPAGHIEDAVSRSQAKLILCDVASYRHHCDSSIPLMVFDEIRESPGSELESIPEEIFFNNLVSPCLDSPPAPAVLMDESTPAAILFTSGTQGRSKGVVLSHGALYRSGKSMAQIFDWRESDTLLNLAGMHTMSGFRNPCFSALHSGTTISVPEPGLADHPVAVAETIRSGKITLLFCVPTFLDRLYAQKSRLAPGALSSLQRIMCTGSPLRVQTVQNFETGFKIPVRNYYGLTETCGFCLAVPLVNSEPEEGNLGIPSGAIIHIVDNSGKALPCSQTGEIVIYSDNLMLGYLDNPDLTNRILKNGWLQTGDFGYRKENGHIVLVGRKDDRIKDKRGEIVYPGEIEIALLKHPDVKEASVLSYPDKDRGQRLAAFLVTDLAGSGQASLIDSLESHIQTQLGIHKVPARFELVPEIPRTSNGKVDVQQLRNTVIDATSRQQ